MKFTLVKGTKNNLKETIFDFQHFSQDPKVRPMALDVLLQAEELDDPELAYRYGCRNGLCGVCTVEVNGRTKLACRTKVREGDKIAPMQDLPVLKDFVVKRDAISRQLQARLPSPTGEGSKGKEDNKAFKSLNRCIECYACVQGCHLHEKNDLHAAVYECGNPFSFLKLQQVLVDPCASEMDKKTANQAALDLGLKDCLDCKGCRCGVGIDMKKEVIRPLLQANNLIRPDSHWHPDFKANKKKKQAAKLIVSSVDS